ncbi:MAG TPA: class I SAM-dependent methyltransferase, partial [Chthoniobacteraceae bacterium]|nr:class I SAM-dependent methyltransferase [Chthoniobacteraceae bacterium]
MDGATVAISTILSPGSQVPGIPRRLLDASAWVAHIPFAFWLVEHHRPSTIVELGVHTGSSYCAFCQAVAELRLDARCFGIDAFKGDEHAGFYDSSIEAELRAYHDPLYGSFSELIGSAFDEAVALFPNASIDLLHIDGRHFFEDVKHDFETWLPKLSARAVVLFHDTAERAGGFGVHQLWDELKKRHPSFEFHHEHGLGVLAVGNEQLPQLQALFSARGKDAVAVRRYFRRFGAELRILATLAPSFDAGYYLASNADVAAQGVDPLLHYHRHGEREGRSPRADFNPAYYLAANPDLKQGISTDPLEVAPSQHPFYHYVTCGKRECRDGVRSFAEEIREVITPYFDREFYLSQYPDVKEAGIDPVRHYIHMGEAQGRKPRGDFDPGYYLATNQDVKYMEPRDPPAVYATRPFLHYVLSGRREGRLGVPLLPVLLLDESAAPPGALPRTGIAVHLFYPDLWDEVRAMIDRFPDVTQLYINLVEGHSDGIAGAVRAAYPRACVEVRPNRGRDVLPFLSQLERMQADGIQAALKIHT